MPNLGLKLYSKKRLICINEKYALFYKNGHLHLSFSDSCEKIIDKKKIGGFLSRFSLVARLLRLEPRASIIVGENALISFCGKIINYNFKTKTIDIDHRFLSGMKSPLSFCLGKDENDKDCVLYGEYFWNFEKGPVSIFSRNESGDWKKVYTFPKNTITHIHRIAFDKESRKYFILTGDNDSESGIWVSDLCFSKVEPIVIGNQLFRSCIMMIENHSLVYATDTPLQTNYLCSYNIDSNDYSIVSEITGSVIYGCTKDKKMYFSTCVEPDSSLKKWHYRLTNRLGKGIKDRFSRLYVYSNGEIKVISKKKKDIFPMWLFEFGTFIFPFSTINRVFVSVQSLVRRHNYTYVIEDGDNNE